MGLQNYLTLTYPITLYPEIEGEYTVMIKDLSGCISEGETLEEAVERVLVRDNLGVSRS